MGAGRARSARVWRGRGACAHARCARVFVSWYALGKLAANHRPSLPPPVDPRRSLRPLTKVVPPAVPSTPGPERNGTSHDGDVHGGWRGVHLHEGYDASIISRGTGG